MAITEFEPVKDDIDPAGDVDRIEREGSPRGEANTLGGERPPVLPPQPCVAHPLLNDSLDSRVRHLSPKSVEPVSHPQPTLRSIHCRAP